MKMQPRNKASVPTSRWLAYATAGVATAAATAPCAEAEIHYFSPVHLHLHGRGGLEHWQLPLTGRASLYFDRFQLGAAPIASYFSDHIGVIPDLPVRAIRWDRSIYAAKLQPGSNVSSGTFFSTFLGLIGPYGGQFKTPGVGFIGFKFDVGSGVQYGWVRTRTTKSDRTDAELTVLDYAFADPGEPIAAGQRSENDDVTRPPAEESLGALALGAVGLSAWRGSRRKKA